MTLRAEPKYSIFMFKIDRNSGLARYTFFRRDHAVDGLLGLDDDDLEPYDKLALRLLRGTTRVDPMLLFRYLTAEEERESLEHCKSSELGLLTHPPETRRAKLFHLACGGLLICSAGMWRTHGKSSSQSPRGALKA